MFADCNDIYVPKGDKNIPNTTKSRQDTSRTPPITAERQLTSDHIQGSHYLQLQPLLHTFSRCARKLAQMNESINKY